MTPSARSAVVGRFLSKQRNRGLEVVQERSRRGTCFVGEDANERLDSEMNQTVFEEIAGTQRSF